MNTRYTETFLFLSRLSRRSNKGFALGFVLTAGVLMAATGAVMLLRSSSETEKIAAQEANAKGQTTAEVAIARMQYILGKYPFLAEMEMDNWQNADVEDQIKAQIQSSCEAASLDEDDINAEVTKSIQEIGKYTEKDGGDYKWLEMNPTNSKQGQFRFTNYEPAIAGQQMGEMTIEAKANIDNELKEAPSKLVVTIPLTQNEAEIEDGDSPGLWIKNPSLGSVTDNLQAAHIWLGSGGDSCGLTKAQETTALGTLKTKVATGTSKALNPGGGIAAELPSGTAFKDPIIAPEAFPDKEMLDEVYQDLVLANLKEGTTDIPEIAVIPQSTPIATLTDGISEFAGKTFDQLFGGVALAGNGKGKGKGKDKDNPTTPETPTPEIPTPETPTSSSSGGVCGAQVSDSLNSSDFQTFPKQSDVPTRIEEKEGGGKICIYDYKINKDLGSEKIVVRTKDASGNQQRVIFHLFGDIDKNTEIVHIGDDNVNGIKQAFKMPNCGVSSNPCVPVDFQIWGHTTEKICMNGNKKLTAFVWAPLANMAMNGGGSGKGGLNGTAFVNTWNNKAVDNCGSSSGSSAAVVQTGVWSDFSIPYPTPNPALTVGKPGSVKTEQYYSNDSD